MKAKRILALLMTLALTLSLAACGDSGGSSTSTSSKDDGSSASTDSGDVGGDAGGSGLAAGTYSFMTWESEDMNQKILASFDKFMADNPGVVVELTAAPLTDYGTKLKTMIASGTAPDIFMVGNDWTLQYGSTGNLYDWTELAAADNLESTFYPGVVENWKVDGKLYGFPGLLNTYGIFYNKTMFDDAGVEYPKNGWTYDDMLADAKALKASAGTTYGLVAQLTFDPFTTQTYAASLGQDTFVANIANNDHVTVSDAMKEVIGKIAASVQSGDVNGYDYDTGNVATEFMSGKIPMLAAGQWFADEFIRNGPEELDWGFVAYPVGDSASPSTIYDCTGWAASASIENPETVYEIIKFIHTEMYMEVLPQNPVAPAASTEFTDGYYETLEAAGHPEMVEALEYMLTCEKKVAIRFLDGFASEAQVYITDQWGGIIDGKSPVDDVDKMAENINAAIASFAG